jgi:hypothetical protein
VKQQQTPGGERPASEPSPEAGGREADRAAKKPVARAGDPTPEIPDSELPPLAYPNSEQYKFRQLAEERRRVRIRNEVIFGGILLVVGLVFLAGAHNPAFLVLALIGAAAMVAYEMTVATLE